MDRKRITMIVAGTAVALAVAAIVLVPRMSGDTLQPGSTSVAQRADASLVAGLQQVLTGYRKIIVLLADEKRLSAREREPANRAGQALFHENLARIEKLDEAARTLVASGQASRFETLGAVLDYIEAGPNMFDADRLAFREFLRALQQTVARDSALPAVKLHKRIADDLDALAEIERNYEKEITQIFSRFETRAIELKRERWDDYVARLRQLHPRDQILRDYGIVLPYPEAKAPPVEEKEEKEIYGHRLPPKTLVLTFDDGPHRQYTEEIAAILKQYGVPAIFFEVGTNLGTLTDDGKAKLSANGGVSRKLKAAGFEIANHSYSHAQLSKQTGAASSGRSKSRVALATSSCRTRSGIQWL